MGVEPDQRPPAPLPLSTTWAVLAGVGATLRRADDLLVVRSDLPGHRWANALGVLDPARVDDAEGLLASAHRLLPGVARPAFGLPARPDPMAWTRVPCPPVDGLDVEWFPQHWLALVATTVSPRHHLQTGHSVRMIASDADWQQFARLPSPAGPEHQRLWVQLKRQRQDAGSAAFFAGFHEGRMVATGGVVLCPPGEWSGPEPGCEGLVARCEDISTDPGHRRRGLAGHVIAAAHDWARSHGANRTVLVADADGDAIGPYRRLGFQPDDEAWMVLPRLRQ